MSDKPVVWSFFSGAMGLDIGLEQAGWEASLAVEIEPKFCATIAANRPGLKVLQADVGDLTAESLFELTGATEVDLMVGGPPCQSFSTGGKRSALDDPRGNAIFEYLRLIAEVRPRAFVLENVANLVTAAIRHRPISERPGKSWNLASYSAGTAADGDVLPLAEDELSGSAFRYLLSTVIADLGYQVKFSVVDAADYGAPQRRLRFVMIGSRDGTPPDIIEPTHGGSVPVMTVRDAISDLQDEPGPGAAYTAETRQIFELVPAGGNWRDLPRDVAARAMGERSLNAGGGKTGFFRRLSWDRPSPTITGKPNRKGSAMCHPAQTRPLSVHECARLQGFPDDWTITGSVADQYLQIGNAVPVALGRAIGMSLASVDTSDARVDHALMLDASIRRLRAAARNTKSRMAADAVALI